MYCFEVSGNSIHFEEQERGCHACPFVAIETCLRLRDVKGVSCSNVEKIAMSVEIGMARLKYRPQIARRRELPKLHQIVQSTFDVSVQLGQERGK